MRSTDAGTVKERVHFGVRRFLATGIDDQKRGRRLIVMASVVGLVMALNLGVALAHDGGVAVVVPVCGSAST